MNIFKLCEKSLHVFSGIDRTTGKLFRISAEMNGKMLFLSSLLFLLCHTIGYATIYYVDAQNGDDTFTGTAGSPLGGSEGPWKTISKVNMEIFLPGDRILFRRGQTWTDGPLAPRTGGEAGGIITIRELVVGQPLEIQLVDRDNHHCIYFGAYGSGAKPRIDCRGGDGLLLRHNYIIVEDLHLDNGGNNMLSFSRIGGNYWNIVRNVDVTNCSGNAVRFEEGGGNCWLDGLNVINYDQNGIYLEGSATNLLNQVLVENCRVERTVAGGQYDAISCHRDGADNGIDGRVIIRNNTVVGAGEDGIDITSGTHILLAGNDVSDSYGGGIFVGKPDRVHTVEIRGNFIHSNSISQGIGDLTIKCPKVRAINNIITGTGHHSLFLETASEVEIWNNVIAPGDRTGNFIWLRSEVSQIDFRNNIFDFTNTNQNIEGLLDAAAFDYNCYATNAPDQQIFSGTTFAALQSADLTFEANGFLADPGFVDPQKTLPQHFQLNASSPCIDQGANLPVGVDFWGTVRPQGAGMDMGVFEAEAPDCPLLAGSPCDDLDPCTINDVYDSECNCVGINQDSDGDSVCDGLDQCPGFDDRLDADADGLPDACDDCDNALLGAPCDDGDPATENDVIVDGCVCSGTVPPPPTIEVRGAGSNDDVEEQPKNGNVNFTSTDLELTQDGGKGNQTVGIRFNDVALLSGMVIDRAYVQFTVDEVSTGAVSLLIQGEATNHALPFASDSYNVSNRARTSAAISWNPPDWNLTGLAGEDQRTPDISSILQEIIDRPGWSPGNSIVLIITGTGKRTATSYDGSQANGPVLHIEYSGGNCDMTGMPCDDGNACTDNDVYDNFCNCTGVLRDADSDGVCDDDDICPGGMDGLDADADGVPDACDDCPNSATGDSDGDGVCDDLDVCPGSSDAIDTDGDGIPDGCDDQNCVTASNDFPVNLLTHSGPLSSYTTLNFDAIQEDIAFSISGLDAKTGGREDRRYVEVVTVEYVDGLGMLRSYGSFSGELFSTVDVSIPGEVISVTITLEDDYDGNSASEMSIAISSVTSCDPGGTCVDSDGDGVCDLVDVCPGFDDGVDTDGDGIPDGCDDAGTDCTPLTNNFPEASLAHTGTGASTMTLDFGGLHQNVAFTISGIDQQTGGKPDQRFIELVTVTYDDGTGASLVAGIYDGAGNSTASINIPGPVRSVTVSLTDGYYGDTPIDLRVDLSEVTSCLPASSINAIVPDLSFRQLNQHLERMVLPDEIRVFPNPATDRVTVSFELMKPASVKLAIMDVNGRVVHIQKRHLEEGYHVPQIEVGHLPAGMYFLNLTLSDQPFIRKFIVAR